MQDTSLDPVIVQKLNSILTSYVCFDNRTQNHKIFKKHAKQNKQYKPVRKNIMSYEVLAREIRSLMNKVNNNNFDVISTKISYLIRDDNIKDIISCIIDSLNTNASYMDLILKLILKLDTKKEYLPEIVKSYTQKIHEDINDYINLLKNDDECDTYDEFCRNSKLQKQIKYKIEFVLEILQYMPELDEEIEELRNFITNIIETTCSKNILNSLLYILFNSKLITNEKLRLLCLLIPDRDYLLSTRMAVLLKI